MPRYEFWVHGVDVQIEYPENIVGPTGDGPAHPRRSGWGMLVYQKANTSNWFHFAIPTPTLVLDQEVNLSYIGLRAEINETARIDTIHVRHGNHILLTQAVDISNGSVDETFPCPKTSIRDGVALCVHISFLPGDARGMVIFKGAGAFFRSADPVA